MATINIANLSFTHRGDYDGSTAYVKNDIVYYATNGNSYIAKGSTTGNVPTSTAHWDLFVAGSSGIWNAGLSLGSAGQVVKVNSGASALEFGTISSDYVKIATQTVSSAVASVNFDNSVVDFSTYKSHVIIFSGVSFASDGGDLAMRMSSNNGSSFINATGQTTYNQMNGTSSGSDNNHGFHPFSVDTESDNDDGFSGQVTITSFSSGNWSYSWGFSVNQHQNGDYYRYENACVHQENSQPNYIRFYEFGSGQNIDQGEFILYGRK